MKLKSTLGILPLFPAKGGEGRGEEGRPYWISPLLDPLPTRASRGEEDERRVSFRLIRQQRDRDALVAQNCILPYRRFAIGKTLTSPTRLDLPWRGRLQTCATADFKSALPGRQAFTLIEFILVMALLAVVIAIAAPSLSNFFRGRKLESEARRFVALARYGQSQAVSDGVPMMLWMDRVEGTYGVREQDGFDQNGFTVNTLPAQPPLSPARQGSEKAAARQPTFRLAQNLRFELEGVNSRTNGRVVMIRFLPDGSIDEAALRVLKLLQEDPEKRREPQTLWIAQSWDNTRYEIVDQTNAWQRLSLETSLQGRLYSR